MELIDIGANLTNKRFRHDLAAVIERARAAGVAGMIVTGTNAEESLKARALALEYPGILHATAGVHPHHARHWGTETADRIQGLASKPEVVALGEMGLDFNRDFSPRPDQERVFEMQLEMAADLNLPVFMHERDAGERFVAIVSRYRDRLKAGVVHCFTGNAEALTAYLDLDLHIGMTGWIRDERRGGHLEKLVRRIPLNRLMLETDAPYLLPRNLRFKPKGGRNEPAFLPYILDTVASCLELPAAVVAQATSRTAKIFFATD